MPANDNHPANKAMVQRTRRLGEGERIPLRPNLIEQIFALQKGAHGLQGDGDGGTGDFGEEGDDELLGGSAEEEVEEGRSRAR